MQASQRGDYEVYLIGWSGRVDADGNTFQFLHSGQGNNVSHYSNPIVDKMLHEGRSDQTDVAKRRTDYYQAWSELQRDLPITYLYNGTQHRRDVGEAARLPPDARRHDPDSGHGDGEVVHGHLGTRIAQIIPTLLLVSVLVFGLQQLMPGDPALVMAGEERANPQLLAQIRSELWLDRSLPVQYVHWMGNVVQGDLGLFVAHPSAGGATCAAEAAGDVAARHDGVRLRGADRRAGWHRCGGVPQSRFWDYVANAVGLAGLSTPKFWLGIMLILLVSVDLGWLPPSGYVPLTEDWRQSLATTIMPAFVLGNAIAAVLMRHTRSAMLTCSTRTMCGRRAPRDCASSSW